MDSEPRREVLRYRGVTFFEPEHVITDDPEVKYPSFISKKVFIGDLGFAQMYGEKFYLVDPIAEAKDDRVLALIDGQLVEKAREEVEDMGLYELGVSLKGGREEGEFITCKIHIPVSDHVYEATSLIDLQDSGETHWQEKLAGTTHGFSLPDNPTRYKGLYGPKDSTLLSQFEFFFQPHIDQ